MPPVRRPRQPVNEPIITAPVSTGPVRRPRTTAPQATPVTEAVKVPLPQPAKPVEAPKPPERAVEPAPTVEIKPAPKPNKRVEEPKPADYEGFESFGQMVEARRRLEGEDAFQQTAGKSEGAIQIFSKPVVPGYGPLFERTRIPPTGQAREADVPATVTDALLPQRSVGEAAGPSVLPSIDINKVLADPSLKDVAGPLKTVVTNKTNRGMSPNDALTEAIKELQELGGNYDDKGNWIGPVITDKIEGAPADPLVQSLAGQERAGSIPQYSSQDQATLAKEIQLAEMRARKEKEYEGAQTLTNSQGAVVRVYKKDETVTIPPGAGFVVRPATQQEIKAEAGKEAERDLGPALQFDLAKIKKIQENPEEYVKRGIVEAELPFGGARETTAGWALRILGAPASMVGTAVVQGLATVGEEQALDKARPELYKGSPYLAGIASPGGATEQMMKLAEIRQDSTIPLYGNKALYGAGGFLIDVLDPSIVAGGAVAKGFQAGWRTSKAVKGMKAAGLSVPTGPVREGVKAAAQFVGKEAVPFVDFTKGFAPTNLRNAVAIASTDEIAAAQRVVFARRLLDDVYAEAANVMEKNERTPAGWKRMSDEEKRPFILDDVNYKARKASVLAGLEGSLAKYHSGTKVSFFPEEAKALLSKGSDEFNAELAKLAGLEGDAARILDTSYNRLGDLISFAKGKQVSGPVLNREELAGYLERLVEGGYSDELVDVIELGKKAVANPALNAKLLRLMAYDDALDLATKATKSLGAEDVIGLTKNTWVRAVDVPKVLDGIKGTFLAETSKRLANNQIVRVDLGNGPVQAFKVSTQDPSFRKLEQLELSLSERGYRGPIITKGIGETGYITTDGFRALLERQVDNVAAKLQVAFTGRAAEQLSPASKAKLLEPAETRDLKTDTEKGIKRGLTSIAETIKDVPVIGRLAPWMKKQFAVEELVPSIRALREGDRLAAEIASLDKRLRYDVARFKQDPAFRATFGRNLSQDMEIQDIMLALSLGKKSRVEKADILEWLVDNSFHIKGSNMNGRSIFTTSTGQAVSRSTEEWAKVLAEQRDLTWELLSPAQREQFLFEARATKDPALGERAVDSIPETLTGREEIKRLVWEAADKPINESILTLLADVAKLLDNPRMISNTLNAKDIRAATTGKLAPDQVAGLYYKAATDDLIKSYTAKLINEDPVGVKLTVDGALRNYWDPKLAREAVGNDFGDQFITLDNLYEELLAMNIRSALHGAKPNDVADAAFQVSLARSPGTELIPDMPEIRSGGANYGTIKAAVEARPELYATLEEAAREVAYEVLRRNGWRPTTKTAIADLEATLADVLQQDPTKIKLFLGKEYDSLVDLVKNNKLRDIEARLAEDPSMSVKKAGKEMLQALQWMFYTATLGYRTRFHGVNWMTAPLISYATIGRVVDPGLGLAAASQAMKRRANIRGADLALSYKPEFNAHIATETMARRGNDANVIAFVDKLGRPYTYDDIYRNVVLGGAGRSEASSIINAQTYDDAITLLTAQGWTTAKAKALLGAPTQLNETIDTYYRLQVAIQALKEGRSMEDATALARRSLFDYGDMSAVEKEWITKFLVFYTFTRQATKNMIFSMMDPERFMRLVRTEALRRSTGDVAASYSGNEKDNVYDPSYMTTRMLFGTKELEDKKNKRLFLFGPDMPALSPLMMLDSTLGGEVARRLPFLGAAGVVDTKVMMDTSKLAPEHVIFPGLEIMETQLGPIKETKDADGNVVYNLSNEQKARYEKMLGLLPGVNTMIMDAARTGSILIGEPVPALKELSAVQKALWMAGLVTPSKGLTPEAAASKGYADMTKELGAAGQPLKEPRQ